MRLIGAATTGRRRPRRPLPLPYLKRGTLRTLRTIPDLAWARAVTAELHADQRCEHSASPRSESHCAQCVVPRCRASVALLLLFVMRFVDLPAGHVSDRGRWEHWEELRLILPPSEDNAKLHRCVPELDWNVDALGVFCLLFASRRCR